MAQTFFQPNEQIIDSNGVPVSGAKLFFFESGTSTPLTVYTNNALTIAHSAPVVADSAGRYATIYLSVDVYKVRIDDAADVTIYTADPYTVVAGLTSGAGLETTSGNILQLAQDLNIQTGTTYTYLDTDRAKQVTHANASAIAGTLPQAGASSAFLNEWFTDVANVGVGLLTITPATSTINTAATLVVPKGMNARIISDGTNYTAQLSKSTVVFPDDGELTVATGVITPTGEFHSVDGESDADDAVITIAVTNVAIGQQVTFTSENAARDITYTHGTDNIVNPAGVDITTTSTDHRITYESDGTNMVFVSKNFSIGRVLQVVTATSSAIDSTSNNVPDDSTIPQTSEMDLISALDVAVTPISPGSTLIVEANVTLSGTTADDKFLAFVKDSGTATIALAGQELNSANNMVNLFLRYTEASTNLTARTFHTYYGGLGGTIHLNRKSSGNTFGGVLLSSCKVAEVL